MLKIYRYNFSKEFLEKAQIFAKKNKNNNINLFKQNWNKWIQNHEIIISNERRKLLLKGYNGDINIKMFKTVRYYLKNKNDKKPVERRKYISLSKQILDEINIHIKKSLHLKPEVAYINFEKESELTINNELKKIAAHLNDKLSKKKIKKTYKNKFYSMKKSINN